MKVQRNRGDFLTAPSAVCRLSVLIIFFCLIAPSSSVAAPVGRITYMEGRANVLKTGRHVARPISLGEDIDAGDVLRTKSDGRAEITFINKNIMKIAPATRVEIKEYMVEEDQGTGIMRLYRGKVLIITSMDFIKRIAAASWANKLEVHTANSIAGIRGSSMLVFYERGITGVLFLTGKGYAYNPRLPDIIVPIAAGEITFIQKDDGPPLLPRPASSSEAASQIRAVTPAAQQESEGNGTGGTSSSVESRYDSTPSRVEPPANSPDKTDKVADSDTPSDEIKESKANDSDTQGHGKSKKDSGAAITGENTPVLHSSHGASGKKDISSVSSSGSAPHGSAHVTPSTAMPPSSSSTSTTISPSSASLVTVTGVSPANSASMINMNAQPQGIGVGKDIQFMNRFSPQDQHQPKGKDHHPSK